MATHFTHPAEYLETVDTSRYECVDGKLTERAVPNIAHSKVTMKVSLLLHALVSKLGMDCGPELSVDRTPGSGSDWMTPDFAVSMPGGYVANKNGHALPPVFLVIEVLSPGQTFKNMGDKLRRYLDWGALHVWLIDPEQREAMTEAADVIRDGGLLKAENHLSIRLDALFS